MTYVLIGIAVIGILWVKAYLGHEKKMSLVHSKLTSLLVEMVKENYLYRTDSQAKEYIDSNLGEIHSTAHMYASKMRDLSPQQVNMLLREWKDSADTAISCAVNMPSMGYTFKDHFAHKLGIPTSLQRAS